MSPAGRDEGGIPRIRRAVAAPPGGASAEEDYRGANEAKAEKLRRKSLQSQAAKRGLQLRHSTYGYALIDSSRKPIDERNNMTLDDIESWLGQS